MGDSPRSVNFQRVKIIFLVIFQFFLLKSTAEVFQTPKMQFSSIYTQMEGGIAFWIFNVQIDGISSIWYLKNQPLVPEKLVIIQFYRPRRIKPVDERVNNYI